MNKAMFSKELIGGTFSNLNKWVTGHAKIGQMSDGMGRDIATKIFNTAANDPSMAGAIYGGAAGAVGGALSSDRNQSWYTGAAQGAFSGYQTARHGLSGRAVFGAGAGAIWGMASNDTSIMGGAFMGAMAFGPGRRHSGLAYNAFKAAGGGKGGLRTGFRTARGNISKELGLKRTAGKAATSNTPSGKPPQRNQAAGTRKPPKSTPQAAPLPFRATGRTSRTGKPIFRYTK